MQANLPADKEYPMGLFDRSIARDYALVRKLAKGLIRWEQSLGTPEQLAQPWISGLLTLDENDAVGNGLSRQFDAQVRDIWSRLYRLDPALYSVAKARQQALTPSSSGSSDMPLVYVPPIIT